MKRFIVFRGTNAPETSHGTALYLSKDRIWITSHPLDAALGVRYFISIDGSKEGSQELLRYQELSVPAPGLAVESISPHLYQLELAKRT